VIALALAAAGLVALFIAHRLAGSTRERRQFRRRARRDAARRRRELSRLK